MLSPESSQCDACPLPHGVKLPDKDIKDMQENGVIQASKSPWSSPVVLVRIPTILRRLS